MVHITIDGKLILSGCLIINNSGEVLLLYRKDHHHYETPGGKVDTKECKDPDNPSREELAKTAGRELHEELGNDIKVSKLEYFGSVEFLVPDGRKAVANKFVTKILSGRPKINEPDVFEKFDFLPVERLGDYPISPDLKLLLPKLKDYIKKLKAAVLVL